jgi:2-(3-amino-3-carboxypropyl)histidine synthase
MVNEDIFPSFKLDMEGIIEVIDQNGYSRVVLQGPEGMKRGLIPLSKLIEERTGSRVWIDGEPCYGACDHSAEKAKLLDCDALIHLGHSDIPSMEMEGSVPVHYFHVEMNTGEELFINGMDKALENIDEGRIALFTTIQHLGLLKVASEMIQKKGIEYFIGPNGKREAFPGQVLGCSFHPARDLPQDVTKLLYVGTGKFHPLGLCMASKKEVLLVDPMTGEISTITADDLEKIQRKRFGQINKFKELLETGEDIGIVLGSKPGQRRSKLAQEVLGLIEKKGFSGHVVILDHMDPMKLRSLGFKCVVSTSCPRIAIDDSPRYSAENVTLLTSIELRIALGVVPWSEYEFDEEW